MEKQENVRARNAFSIQRYAGQSISLFYVASLAQTSANGFKRKNNGSDWRINNMALVWYDNSYVPLDGMMMQSVSGGGHHGGGLFINTLDHARFGLLFLRKGKWKNQQLISEQWVASVNQPSDANKSYGLMWWTNQENALGDISKNIYYANGFGGNYIVVDNEHDLVIVTRWLDTSKLGEFVRLVVGSVENKK